MLNNRLYVFRRSLFVVFATMVAHVCGALHAGAGSELEKLKQALKSPSEVVRADAIRAAKISDTEAAQVAELLAPLLADRSRVLQQAASLALVNLKAKAVPALIQAARTPDARRRVALAVLRQIGPEAKAAVPALIELTKEKDSAIRQDVLLCFVALGAEVKSAVPAIVELLRDPDLQVRVDAESVLAKLGPDVIPQVSVALARTEDLTKWPAVIRLIVRLHPKDQPLDPSVAKVLTKHLGDNYAPLRLTAIRAVNDFGPVAKSLAPAVAPFLTEVNALVRDAAINALLSMGPDAGPAAKEYLRHANIETRLAAGSIIGGLAIQRKELAKELLPLLDDKETRVRRRLATMLGAIDGSEVVAPLVVLLRDVQPEVRVAAGQSITRVARNPRTPLAGLVQNTIFTEFHKIKDAEARVVMLSVVADLGPPSQDARAEFTKLFKDPQPEIRSAIIRMWLRTIPPAPEAKAYLEPVVAGLYDRDWQTRRTAALGLVRIGGEGVASLVDVVENGAHPFAKADALLALGTLGAGAKPALKQLIDAARDPSLHVRIRAITVLNVLAPDAVADLLSDPDNGVRVSALNLIQREPARKAKAAILKMLRDRDDEIRTVAARTLVRIGPLTVIDLDDLLTDKDARVRRAAIQATEGQASPAQLKKYLGDDAAEMREAVSASLALHGPSAFAVLADSLHADDFRIQKTAANAITPIVERADDLIPLLVEGLLGKERGEWYARAIHRVNPVLGARELARRAKPVTLVALLKDAALENQLLACLALSEHGIRVDDAMPLLEELVKNPKTEVNLLAAAVRALRAAGAKDSVTQAAPDLITRLVRGTHDKSKRLRDENLADQSAKWKGDSMESILAALYLGEFTDDANEWIIHHANTQSTFGWGSQNFVRVLGLFHSGNKRFRGRLSPTAELALKDHFWRFFHEQAPGRGPALYPLPTDVKATLPIDRLVWLTSAYLALDVLKDDPVFKDRPIQGRPLVELFDEWTLWWREWAKHRSLHGLWSEMGLASHQVHIWPCMLNMIDCASDPVVKQRCKMLLDITAIEEEQISIQGTRAGRRGKKAGLGCGLDQWKDLLFGELPRRFGEECADFNGIIWTTTYEMPTAAILLRKLDRPVSHYAVTNHNFFNGSVFAYSTPHYVLASQLSQPGGSMEFPGAWQRLVFDDMNAIFFPHYVGSRRHVQYKSVYITRCVRGAGDRQSIDFTADLKIVERGDWFFASNGPAFAAVYVVGGYEIEKTERKNVGPQRFDSLVMKDSQATILLHTGDILTFGSFEKFQAAILKAPLKITAESLHYTGPKLLPIEFFRTSDKLPLIDGEPHVYRSTTDVYDSPYLHAKVGAAEVAVRVGAYSAMYDFEKNTIVEAKAKN